MLFMWRGEHARCIALQSFYLGAVNFIIRINKREVINMVLHEIYEAHVTIVMLNCYGFQKS
jgi:hypothetical protein